MKWVQWSSPSYRRWNLTSEWSGNFPRRCSVSPGGETLPRPPPPPKAATSPHHHSLPQQLSLGASASRDTDNVPRHSGGRGTLASSERRPRMLSNTPRHRTFLTANSSLAQCQQCAAGRPAPAHAGENVPDLGGHSPLRVTDGVVCYHGLQHISIC